MKNTCLLIIVAMHILSTTALIACLYEFSPHDIRPFFEQYEKEIPSQPSTEKEKAHEKNSSTHTQSFNNTSDCKS